MDLFFLFHSFCLLSAFVFSLTSLSHSTAALFLSFFHLLFPIFHPVINNSVSFSVFLSTVTLSLSLLWLTVITSDSTGRRKMINKTFTPRRHPRLAVHSNTHTHTDRIWYTTERNEGRCCHTQSELNLTDACQGAAVTPVCLKVIVHLKLCHYPTISLGRWL